MITMDDDDEYVARHSSYLVAPPAGFFIQFILPAIVVLMKAKRNVKINGERFCSLWV